MFDTIGLYLLVGIEWIYEILVHNYALCIVIATLIIKLITLPLDIKQRKSMAKMSGANDEMQKIQKRYGNNPEVLRQKQQEYYKKNNISPMGGCLPMIITMLVFIIFLRSMNFWAQVNSIRLYLDPSMIDQCNFLWVNNIWMPDSGLATIVMPFSQFSQLPFDKLTLFFDQSVIDSLKLVTEPQYIAQMSLITEAPKYAGYMNGWFVLPVLAGGSMLLTTLITTKLNPQPANAQGAGMTKTMNYVFAAFSVYICVTNNAGFSLYWLASNVISLGVTFLVSKIVKKDQELEALKEGARR